MPRICYWRPPVYETRDAEGAIGIRRDTHGRRDFSATVVGEMDARGV